MPLKQTLSRHWFRFQRELFPWLEEALGPLGERYQRLVRMLELVRVEEWLPYSRGGRGRPLKDRAALARAFLAKAVLDVPTTRALVERLRTEGLLRRLCGWEAAGGVPSEATFSRAFAEFAASDLPGRLHEALLDRTLEGHLERQAFDDAGGDAGGTCRRSATSASSATPRESGELDRLQAAHRRHRRRHSGQLPAHLSLGARQSGGRSRCRGLTASRVDSLYDLMDSAV